MPRRSAQVSFTVLSLSAALVACESSETQPGAHAAPVYASVEACKQANPGVDCEAAMKQAELEHLKTAPVSPSRAQCEQEWGDGHCQERPSTGGGSVFIPVLAGFMLGRALSGPGYPQGCGPGDPRCGPGGGGGAYTAHGVYAGRAGLFAGGERIGDAEMRGGRYVAPATAFVAEGPGGKVSAGRVTRGGFGGGGEGEGGHGGGRGG